MQMLSESHGRVFTKDPLFLARRCLQIPEGPKNEEIGDLPPGLTFSNEKEHIERATHQGPSCGGRVVLKVKIENVKQSLDSSTLSRLTMFQGRFGVFFEHFISLSKLFGSISFCRRATLTFSDPTLPHVEPQRIL